MKNLIYMAALSAVFAFTSCSDDDDVPAPPAPSAVDGLFIVCNGNYMSGNGSLSYYTPSDNKVENDLFQRANGMKLGDTAQSMTIAGGKGWICVNGSNVIYAIDIDDYEIKGRVTGVASPRNVLAVGSDKLYVSVLYDNRIAIVDPESYTVTGHIDIEGMDVSTGSTEQMIMIGDYVYVNCWSYQKEVLKIDTRTDKVVDRLEVGIQPQSMAYDGRGLWVLCDGGGWDGNPVGFETPSLSHINLTTFEVDHKVTLHPNTNAAHLRYYDSHLYWLEGGVQRMSVTASEAPDTPFIASDSYGLYNMTINPDNGDIYVADAIDYTQPGTVTRYDASGTEVASFNVGVIPAGFCWKSVN